MTSTEKFSAETLAKPEGPLVVVDARLARSDANSGISRFIIGLSRALVEELAARQQRDKGTDKAASIPRVLFVSKHEPPQWIVELVRKHPSLASFWSGGPGAFAKDLEKPVYAWSTFSLSKIDDLSGGNFFWLAPGNFDRPLLFLSKRKRALTGRLIQVIHDAIPFHQKEGMGFFFRMQFKLLVRRTLARLPNVFTVSEHSAAQLKSVVSKRTDPIHVLNCGIERTFGSKPRIGAQERLGARAALLTQLNADLVKAENRNFLDQICRMKWVVGVGRGQKYKRWDLAMASVMEANKHVSEGVLFIRIAASEDEVAEMNSGNGKPFDRGLFIADRATLAWPGMSDNDLYELYRCSDALIHPSLAEGFGFPPIEAAVSGLPVIYAKGTAVDGHFHESSLPENFWRGVASNTLEDWSAALVQVVRGDDATKRFFAELDRAPVTREFMLRFAARRFDWRDSAATVLNAITSSPQG